MQERDTVNSALKGLNVVRFVKEKNIEGIPVFRNHRNNKSMMVFLDPSMLFIYQME